MSLLDQVYLPDLEKRNIRNSDSYKLLKGNKLDASVLEGYEKEKTHEAFEIPTFNDQSDKDKFVTLVGHKILSSSNEWIDVEDLTIGDVLVSYNTGSSEKGTTTIKDIEAMQWSDDYVINNTYKFMSGSRVYNSSNGSSGWSFAQIQDVAVGSHILSSSLQSVQVSSSLARSTATANASGDRIGWVINAEPSNHYFVSEVLVNDNI